MDPTLSIPHLCYSLVEDPSEDFVRLRDFVDVSNALELLKTFSDPLVVKAGFSEDMVKVNTCSSSNSPMSVNIL